MDQTPNVAGAGGQVITVAADLQAATNNAPQGRGAVSPASRAAVSPAEDDPGAVVELNSEATRDHLLPSGSSFWQVLACIMGLIAVISFAMITGGLLNGDGLRATWATIFGWSLTFLIVIIKAIQAKAAADANRARGWNGVQRVLDKATRQSLLTYFVLDSSKHEQEHHTNEVATERDEEEGCGGGEKVGGIASKGGTTPNSSTLPPSFDETTTVVPGCTPITVARELCLKVEDDCEHDLTPAMEASTSARERPPSDDLPPAGVSAQLTEEDSVAFREGSCRSLCLGTKKGSGRLDSSEWYTTGTCIVCFGDYSRGDRLCRMPCGHTYHAACIDEWLDRAKQPCCPLCKIDLFEDLSAAGDTVTRSSEGPVADNAGMEAV